MSIEFTLEWRSAYPECHIQIGGDNVSAYTGQGYAVRVTSSSLRLYRNGSTSGFPSQSYQFVGRNKARVRICMSKAARSITALIDGVVVAQWTDPAGFVATGKGLLFYPQQVPAKISNILVTRWDGELPGPNTAPSPKTNEDTVELANGDRITGGVKSIVDGMLHLGTEYALLEIPMSRAVQLTFSSGDAERARRNRNDVRAHFRSGAVLTIDLLSLAEGTARGASENFGETTFPLRQAQLLEFNIYDERDEDGWSFR